MDELNIGVEFIPVTYGTIDSQLNMMLPAGEDLDCFHQLRQLTRVLILILAIMRRPGQIITTYLPNVT